MDLTILLSEMLHPMRISSWWDDLNSEQKFQFAKGLKSQLANASDKYCENANIWELYYELQQKYRYWLDKLGYSVDWNKDLHIDSENYDNFMDCKDDIVSELAQVNIDWFLEIFPLMPELDANGLKKMLICYLEELPVWRD